jgi:hypothetical protein
MPDADLTPWVIRQVIAGFPADLQAGLREAMRKERSGS